jgi:hypothetical protein
MKDIGVMKRLIFLTLLLTPLAISGLRPIWDDPRPSHHIGPRVPRRIVTASTAPEAPKVLRGYPKATPENADREARRVLREEVARWLGPDGVPASWKAPEKLLSEMVRLEPMEESAKDYGTVYVRPVRLDVSDASRERLIVAYERDLAGQRLVRLGGLLGFVLVCLGAISGYIRTDEATKGYYTNRLRLATLAGVGAAGYALYRFLA